MSIFEVIKKHIVRITHTDGEAIQPDTALKSLKADSLHWVQIIIATENDLDIAIDIDKERMQSLTTIADLVRYIEGFRK